MPEFDFVDLKTDGQLATIVPGMARIGVDTEFVREKTYYAELCLIQVAAGNGIYCADPMGLDPGNGEHTRDFWTSIVQPQWVIHSGRQDFEVVYHTAGILPSDVFDTQVAAALLGFAPQIGYGNLVKELFDVELAKSHTRADWTQRPLPRELMEYAAEDVQYLLPAYDNLTERLDKAGRLHWAFEDSRDLLDLSLYAIDAAQAVNRLKGARNMLGGARAAAVHLATWREQEAVRRNRPRQWIMRDAVLLEIATKRPDSRAALGAIAGLASRTYARAADELLRAVSRAQNEKTDYVPPPRPSESQKATLRSMQKLVADTAAALDIAAEVIAPRKELSAAMLGDRDLRVFRGWRREQIGERLLGVL